MLVAEHQIWFLRSIQHSNPTFGVDVPAGKSSTDVILVKERTGKCFSSRMHAGRIPYILVLWRCCARACASTIPEASCDNRLSTDWLDGWTLVMTPRGTKPHLRILHQSQLWQGRDARMLNLGYPLMTIMRGSGLNGPMAPEPGMELVVRFHPCATIPMRFPRDRYPCQSCPGLQAKRFLDLSPTSSGHAFSPTL
jgi:hypothetical protein